MRIHKRIYDDRTACLRKLGTDVRKKNPSVKSTFIWDDVTCPKCLALRDDPKVEFRAQTLDRKVIRRPRNHG